jgi:hypothetical protein
MFGVRLVFLPSSIIILTRSLGFGVTWKPTRGQEMVGHLSHAIVLFCLGVYYPYYELADYNIFIEETLVQCAVLKPSANQEAETKFKVDQYVVKTRSSRMLPPNVLEFTVANFSQVIGGLNKREGQPIPNLNPTQESHFSQL